MGKKKLLPLAEEIYMIDRQTKAYEKVTAMKKLIADKDNAIEGATLEWYKDARNASVRSDRALKKLKELMAGSTRNKSEMERYKYSPEITTQFKNACGEFILIDNIYLAFCQHHGLQHMVMPMGNYVYTPQEKVEED